MRPSDFDVRPALLALAGGIGVIVAALVRGPLEDPVTWVFVLGGGLSCAGAWWFRSRALLPDVTMERERGQLQRDQDQFERERRALDVYKSDVEEEALVLEKRRHKLSLQLAQTVGWWELGNPDETEEDLPITEEKERQVLAFCRAESERLFNKVIENGYVEDGVLQPEEIYRDLIRLFEGVAKIYQSDSDHPLMETSIEQVLRFLHNVSLQLLVQLEQLPMDVKSLNIRETYRFVKKAMDTYGMYKKVNPYWNYAKPAIFLSRFALGANPIALGLSWTLTELASISGKKISSRYTRKYGLRLFHETIRIIGGETAAVYGANFRDRDPDWIYATELIEMAHHFPPSRESLEASLKEIGRLPLHSEYDRVYLYRCLANRFSAKPKTHRNREILGMTDGVQVAKRLEKQFALCYALEDPARVLKWRRGVESRLGVKLQLGAHSQKDAEDEFPTAFYSLASYLLGHKMLELDQAELHLRASRTASAMGTDALSKGLLRVRQAPPMVFDYPDEALSKEVADKYLDDLLDLQLEVFPREPDTSLLEEAAIYFREKPEPWIDRVGERSREYVLGQLASEAPRPHIDIRLAQALLTDLAPDERLQLLYMVSGVEGNVTFRDSLKALALIGTNRRPLALLGFSVKKGEKSQPFKTSRLWIPEGPSLHLDYSKTFLTEAYRLRGGTWAPSLAQVAPGAEPPTIRMRNRRSSNPENYFDCLLERLRQLHGTLSLPDSEVDELGETGPASP